ncbi:ArnT family glycosyltransferase [Candidatus Margulisiibacteriota bacterium]
MRSYFPQIVKSSQRIQLLFLMLLAMLLFTWGIGSYPFTDGDATFYGQIAKNMLEYGDWITLRFDHFDADYFVDKPPLTMWTMAGMFKLFGYTEFAGRIWHSLLAVLTVLLTYLLGLRLFKHQVSLLAGFILTTSLQFFYQAREPLQDIPIVFCVVLAFYLFIRFIQQKQFRYYYLLCAVLGIAVMIKGPVGVILPGIVMFFTLLFSKGFRNFTVKEYSVHLPLGAGLFLLICLPWHVAEYLKEGSQFFEFYFGQRTFSRYFTGAFFGSGIPAYLVYVILGFLPWTLFFFQAIRQSWKRLFFLGEADYQYPYLFLVVWMAVTFIFFAISPGNIFMRYMLPLYPAAALLTAKYLYDHINLPQTTPGIIAAVIGILLSITAIVFNVFSDSLLNPTTIAQDRIYVSILSPFLLSFATAMLVCAYHLLKKNNKTSIYLLIFFISISYLVFTNNLRQNIHKALPQKQIAAFINQNYPSDVQITKYMPGSSGLTMLSFYLKPYLKPTRTEAELQEFLNANDKALVIVEDKNNISGKLRGSLQMVNSFNNWGVYQVPLR